VLTDGREVTVVAMSGARLVEFPQVRPLGIVAIKAFAEPQTLSRISGLFAQFGVTPVTFVSRQTDQFLLIDIQFDASEGTRIDILVAKLRALILVQRADLVDQ
jgi:hypothetical protein